MILSKNNSRTHAKYMPWTTRSPIARGVAAGCDAGAGIQMVVGNHLTEMV